MRGQRTDDPARLSSRVVHRSGGRQPRPAHDGQVLRLGLECSLSSLDGVSRWIPSAGVIRSWLNRFSVAGRAWSTRLLGGGGKVFDAGRAPDGGRRSLGRSATDQFGATILDRRVRLLESCTWERLPRDSPQAFVVGLVRIELTTSALSVLRSNRLSYSPVRVRGYTKGMTT